MAEIKRWIGGPGTGKTRLIQRELTEAREALGLSTDQVGCCTFTRAGRQELSERVAASWGVEPEALTKSGWFRTAHSIAFKQAGIEEGRLLEGSDGADWISDAVGQRIVAKRRPDGETEFESGEGNNSATLALKAWELARQTMTTLQSVIRVWSSLGDESPTLGEAQAIVDKYEIAKTREGRLDFTDLVSLYAGVKHTSDGPVEVSPVGEVPESLRVLAIDEAQDSSAIVDRICRRLAASPNMERVLIVGDPYQCQPAGTPVLTDSGYKAIEDLDENKDTLVAFDPETKRIVHGCRFQAAWRPVESHEIMDVTFCDGTVVSCTENHKWWIYEVDDFVLTSHLIPGEHSPPHLSGPENHVCVKSVTRRPRGGKPTFVYSLNVEKHHTYVTTNGIVTGNSIFGFGGSDFRHFLSWDADEQIMPQSYRCPRNVMALGEECIRQMRSGYRDRGIVPASHDGKILHADDADDAIRRIRPDESTLILGRCGFSLLEYEAALTAAKVPYAWIDAASPTASLSGYKCLWDLEHGKIVHGDDWANAIAILAVKHKDLGKLLIHGEKAAWKEGRRSSIDFIRPIPDDLALAGCEQPLVQLILSGRWTEAIDAKHAKKAASWRSCASLHGPELASSPKVRLSTIHSAKGCEGDTVILSTVSSYAVESARQSLPARWDEECRVNYVGVTRARQNLIVVGDGKKFRLELPI